MFLKKSSLREESDVSVGGGREDAGEASVPPVECPTPQRTQLFQSVNLDKYILQFGQIHFTIYTNTFYNWDKYSLQFRQIHLSTFYTHHLLP